MKNAPVGPALAIVAWVGERLAGYLAVLGLAGSSGTARLVAGQFHDVVLAGEVAYRFPWDEESRRKLPAVVALLATLGQVGLPVPVPLATSDVQSPLGRCHVPLCRLAGRPLGQVRGRAAEQAVVTELPWLLDQLAGLAQTRRSAAWFPGSARITGPCSPARSGASCTR